MKERRLTLITPDRPVDIVAFGLVMALTLGLSVAGVVSDFLTALAFVTVFFVPGYMMQAALFPASRIHLSNQRIPDVFERVAISLVLSFLVVSLSLSLLTGSLGVVLVEIGKDMVASIVLMVTALASIVAVDRRLAVPKERAFRVVWVIKPGVFTGTEKLVAVAALLLVVASGFNAAFQLGHPSSEAAFTTFAIYGPDGSIGSLPNEIIAGNATALELLIECKENHDVQYQLTITLDNRSALDQGLIDLESVNALDKGTAYSTNISLINGQVWTKELQFSILAPGEHTIYLQLDVPGQPAKQLWLWVNVT